MQCESQFFNLHNGDHDLMLPLSRTPRRAMEYIELLKGNQKVQAAIRDSQGNTISVDPSNQTDAPALLEALMYGDAKLTFGE